VPYDSNITATFCAGKPKRRNRYMYVNLTYLMTKLNLGMLKKNH